MNQRSEHSAAHALVGGHWRSQISARMLRDLGDAIEVVWLASICSVYHAVTVILLFAEGPLVSNKRTARFA